MEFLLKYGRFAKLSKIYWAYLIIRTIWRYRQRTIKNSRGI